MKTDHTRTDKKRVYVTTSWDDGHVLDLRLAKLLKKYGMQGTFYVCPKNRQWPRSELLSNAEVVELSKNFEIGGHTITHPDLISLSPTVARQEIQASMRYLKKLHLNSGAPFAYTHGKYNNAIREIVAAAGFVGGRTVRQTVTQPKDKFKFPTTLHAVDQSLWMLALFAVKNNPSMLHCLRHRDWESTAKRMFDTVLKTGGVFHLYGHSWEIERNGDWDRLENFFTYVSKRRDVSYVTNSYLMQRDV